MEARTYPTCMQRELVLFVPLDPRDNRRARVVIQVLEDGDDPMAPGTCREPLVRELETICGALVMRHYNFDEEDQD